MSQEEQRLWIIIPKWEEFQHYHDRDPKWIKSYISLLRKDAYLDLTSHQRAVLHGLWLVYASNHSEVRLDTRSLGRRLNLRVSSRDISALIEAGWVVTSDNPEKRESNWASRYVSAEVRTFILERDQHKCRACGATDNLEIDHIIPISQDGTGEIGNLQTLCRSCNRLKRARQSVPGPSSTLARARGEGEVELEKEKNFLTGQAPTDEVIEEHSEVLAVPTANTLVSEFIDGARGREIEVPRKIVGHLAKSIKELLDEGQTVEAVRAGLARMVERRIIQPGLLANFVMEAALPASKKPPARVFGYGLTTGEILDYADKLEQEGE